APQQKQLTVEPKGLADVRFELKAAKVLAGRVVDSQGNGIAGAWIYTDKWRGTRTLNTNLTSDANGCFTWDSAPDDDVIADVMRAGYGDNRGVAIRAGQDNIVKLITPTTVRATVVDAQTGQPIQKFNVIYGIDWKREGGGITWQRPGGSSEEWTGK